MDNENQGLGAGKYLFAAVVPVLLLISFLTFHLVHLNKEIALAQSEMDGMKHVSELYRLSVLLQDIRGQSALRAAGAPLGKMVEQFEGMTETLSTHRLSRMFDTRIALDSLRQAVRQLHIDRARLSREQVFQAHSALILGLHATIQEVAVKAGLVLDGHLETYYLMALVIEQLPALTEVVGQLRGVGSVLFERGEVDDADRVMLGERMGAINFGMEKVIREAQAVRKRAPSLAARLNPLLNRLERVVWDYAVQTRRLLRGDGKTDSAEYFRDGTETIGIALHLHKVAGEMFDRRLTDRVHSFRALRLQLLFASVFTIGVIVFFMTSFYRQNRSAFRQLGARTNALAREVVERTRTEEALRASEARWRSLVENAPDVILTVSREGRITFSNHPLPEGQGEPLLLDYAPQAHREEVRTAVERVFATGEPGGFEIPSVDRPLPFHGTWYSARLGPIMENGRVSAITVICRDITAAKEAEERLQESRQRLLEKTRRLNRVNDELQQFAHVASHDLKAPLRAVHGLASCIAEDLGEDAPEEVRHHLELLQQRVRRMHRFIEGLLEYSAGETNLAPETVNIRDLIAEIAASLALPVSFRIIMGDNLPCLETDRLRIQQVFANLIANAAKHHYSQAGEVRILAREKRRFFEFAVSDDGPGIAAEHHERIFQMFQTLRRRDEEENTGIGLALVKKIVQTVGGRIWVDSAPGDGATFRFTWPKRLNY